jgi:hypothetical protein
MADYHPLIHPNHQLPHPEPDPVEEPEVLQPEVEVVWNHFEKGGAKTIAVKITFRIPLNV